MVETLFLSQNHSETGTDRVFEAFKNFILKTENIINLTRRYAKFRSKRYN